MRIFVGLDITHKSTTFILLTRQTWYYTQVHRVDITQKSSLDITHKTHIDITNKLYNTTSPPQLDEDTYWLDMTHNSELILLAIQDNESWCCTINNSIIP